MFLKFLLVFLLIFATGIFIWQNIPMQTSVKEKLDPSYHYIIVGGGTAGCVLASRLSEDPDVTVLLLEAGGEDTTKHIAEIPLAAIELQRTEVDWSYLIEPQKNACKSFENSQILWPSGKGLGGSSLINYLVYSRGNPGDYETWAERGCQGWGYEDVLPYFIKAENNQNKLLAQSEYHGNKGPLAVSYMSGTDLFSTFILAGMELGHKQVDYNSDRQIDSCRLDRSHASQCCMSLGVSGVQATALRGSRQNTALAYLRPILNRPNLHVATRALARKIVIKSKRAVGVEFVRNDTIYTIQAKREVIVSAGAVGSPKLLQLSGIGPKAHLDEIGIPVVTDLPVGDNLQDHVYPLGIQYTIQEPRSASEQSAKTLLSLMNYLIFGDGRMSSSGIDGVGFFRSNAQPSNDSRPYLEVHLHNALLTTVRDKFKRQSLRKTLRTTPQVFEALFEGLEDTHGFLLAPGLLHPRSTGTVRLRSSNYKDPPVVDPRYLSDPADINVLLDGIRLVESIANTKSFQHIGAASLSRHHPHCSEHEYGSDAYWICFIQQNLYSMHHVTGTCKMGAATDAAAVVTPDLKVKGLSNIRVADASVIPEPLSGDTGAAVVMIAEKAADLILERVTVTRRGAGALYDDSDFAEFHHDDHDEL